MRKLRILALMHIDLVPPKDVTGVDLSTVSWKTEFDVVETLKGLGHQVFPVGVWNDLSVIREAIETIKPHIAFNLLEEFANQTTYDQNVVSYLELLGLPYTGCNPRGLMLARDKGWTKKILSYHRISAPEFLVVPIRRTVKRPKRLAFPLIVKSMTEEASLGISQASIVEDDEKLRERVDFIHHSTAVGTTALVERYIEGRELYVGVLGNTRLQVLPIWELVLENMPEDAKKIATARVKWSDKYQKKYGIRSQEAKGLSPELQHNIQKVAKRVYRHLAISGYARIDLRLAEHEQNKIYVLEANPNAQLAYGEDLAESAEHAGLSYPDLLQRIINLGLQFHLDR
ncbi:MAG: ATP-grasp domain-containing protein [Nitrospirae bacterium]|nr:ATP-grasp domain-containing protein [Nitrospirota bacterium]MDA1303866.1 ATP-grasp domain-containing protein [Nitrospirota bacterium]